MNQFILMAEVIQEPQLRYTSDNQTPIAELTVQFEPTRDSDPPGQLKVVGWGGLAQEIQAEYHVGDRVIIEGRLGMNTVDRPEGFKEKRAELTVSRIHRIEADASLKSSAAEQPAAPRAASPAPAVPEAPAYAAPAKSTAAKSTAAKAAKAPAVETADYDDIPF